MTNKICKFNWGRDGAIEASEDNDYVVIVDTLSFSTTVAYATTNSVRVYPQALGDDTTELSKKYDAEIAVGRLCVPEKGRFSLSPLTYNSIEKNTKVVLPALNGGTCCKLAQENSAKVIVGALVNAKAVANHIMTYIAESDNSINISVIACGERFKEPNMDGEIRFAIEDYLGAGAIISELEIEKTPEAIVCEGAFKSSKNILNKLIWECESGIELREIGFGDDVVFASKLNSINVVPILLDDVIIKGK